MLRKILPNGVKLIIYNYILCPLRSYIFRFSFNKKISFLRKKFKEVIFLVATPEHGNLGDHAIVYAQNKILTDIGLSDRVIEIPNSEYKRNKLYIKKHVAPNDIILIDGGGNLGTLWPNEDDKITEIIDTYQNNTIIVFPQTCYYDSTESALARLNKNKETYAKAKDLTISLRDIASYQFCTERFNESLFTCIPDIVLYLTNLNIPITPRSGVLLCFRKDLEKVISTCQIDKIKEFINNEGFAYKETSTLTDYNVSSIQRESELFKKWTEFASAELIITDRLHAMIFAVITHTPCLAIDNVSKKVSGVYELIPPIDYIKICNNSDEIISLVHEYMDKSSKCNFSNLDEAYQQLKEKLINSINNG